MSEGKFIDKLRQTNKEAGLWGDDDYSLSLNDIKSVLEELRGEFPCEHCGATCYPCGCNQRFFKASWDSLFGQKRETK